MRDRLKLVFCALVWGTLGPFVRVIPLSSGEIAFSRAVIALFALLVWRLVSRREKAPAVSKRTLAKLLLSGAAIGANWILLFEAYRYTTVSLATLSYYFAPAIVLIACPVLFRERLGVRQIVCFAAASAGLILVIGADGARVGARPIGVLLGLGAAVLYASVVLLNKSITEASGVHRTTLQFAVAAGLLLPYILCTGGFSFAAMNVVGWISLTAIGLVHTALTYCVFFSAVPRLPGQTVSFVTYVDPLTAMLLSAFVLREPTTLLQLLGGALILGFTLLNELYELRSGVKRGPT